MLTDTVYKRSETFCLNAGDEREGQKEGDSSGKTAGGNSANARERSLQNLTPALVLW